MRKKPSDTSTHELLEEQSKRKQTETHAVDESALPDEERQHRRRADKAAYLQEKLAERERAEREAD
jgi:hypothetical protein